MAMVDGPEPPNTVAQVFQKGYLLADRVLRPQWSRSPSPRRTKRPDADQASLRRALIR
jgi:hypothetical protein